MQAISDDCYEQFVVAVAEGRGLPLAEVRQLATGQLYTGNQALSLGLVDELGGLDRATELAASLAGITAPHIEEYGSPTPVLQRLLGGFVPSLPLSEDELLFLKVLEGWQGMPRY
jgi:protease-4